MVTRGIRTPKRRKVWADHIVTTVIGNTPGIIDVLGSYKTDIGSTNLSGHTVMRVIGHLELTAAAQATSAAYEQMIIGFTVLNPQVLGLADGAAGIPFPVLGGARDSRWLQCGSIEGAENDVSFFSNQPIAAVPPEAVRWNFDFTQQRKLDIAESSLAIVFRDRYGSLEASTTEITGLVSTLLALP